MVKPKITSAAYPQTTPIKWPKIVFLPDAILAAGFVASRKAVGPRDGNMSGCLRINARSPRLKRRVPVTIKVVNENFIFLCIWI